ncbi:MAG: ribosome assembly cofactor RimP [Saprospiraceae bacterium]|nr:ribosome assembly cofactor RimP [Saprospiraceae bacterium]
MIEQQIKDLLDKKFSEPDFSDCFLIEVMNHGSRIQVYLDSDEGLSLGRCQKISRFIEAVLDEEQWMQGKYTLEVSSPGVTRPLVFPRQYNKHIGRKLEVKTVEGEKVEGRLAHVGDQQITLQWKERVKEGKKKKNIDVEKEIAFSEIEKAIIKISFN